MCGETIKLYLQVGWHTLADLTNRKLKLYVSTCTVIE